MPTIRQEMIRGVTWNAITSYSGTIIGIIVSMILARLLSPTEYGVIAIATVLIAFLQMFCTLGIGPAVIHRDDLTEKNLDSIFTFTLCIGIVLAALFFCASWPIASFYGNRQLIPVCQILSLQLLFSSANMVPNALMSKHKRFQELAQRSLTLQISSGIVSVIAAFYGAGVYALLISPTFTAIGVFVWNRMYYRVRIDWSHDIEPVKRIFSFSSYQFLFEFVNYFSRNLDKLIIGKYIGAAPLGIYEKSYRLMQLPMQNITSVIHPVLLPVLNCLQNDKEELSRKYAKLIKFIAIISFPVGIILSGMSTETIRFFFGHKWDDAIPVTSILALSLPLQMILSTSGPIYMVCDNTKMQFWLGIRNTATTITGFIIAAICFKTLEAMAWAWTITLAINFFCTYHLMYRYVLKTSILSMLKELIHPAICAILVFALLFCLNFLISADQLILSIIIKGGASVFLTLIYIQLSKQYDIVGIIKSKLIKNKHAS